MNREKKKKKLFSVIDEKKFVSFAKLYASKDEAFAGAITKHFMSIYPVPPASLCVWGMSHETLQ